MESSGAAYRPVDGDQGGTVSVDGAAYRPIEPRGTTACDKDATRLHPLAASYLRAAGLLLLNGLRAIGEIHALEERLRRPILTANQVLLWQALRLVGITSTVTHYGRVFTKGGPTR